MNAQESAVLEWMTEVTHAVVELNPGRAVPLLEALTEVKAQFGVEQSVGEPA